jgi:hypothetical protein
MSKFQYEKDELILYPLLKFLWWMFTYTLLLATISIVLNDPFNSFNDKPIITFVLNIWAIAPLVWIFKNYLKEIGVLKK